MIKKPLISVITPTYNRADFLPETIDSVLSQEYPNVEHLIIDDGSTDNTRELVEHYKKSGKVRYFYQKNSGQNIARNRGVAEAKGEFICFLDSDDKFLPNKLGLSIEAFKTHPEVDVVYGDYVFIDKDGEELTEKNMRRHSGNITRHLLRDNCVSMNTTMVRASTIREAGGFSNHVKVADDYDLWLRLSVQSQFYYLPEKLSAYRLMSNQISSDKVLRFKSNEEIIKRFFESNPETLTDLEKHDAMNSFYTRAARHFSAVGDFRKARYYLLKAFLEQKYSWRTWRTAIRFALNLIKRTSKTWR